MGRVYNALLRSERLKQSSGSARVPNPPARVDKQQPARPAPAAIPAREARAVQVEKRDKPTFDNPAFELTGIESIDAVNTAAPAASFEAEASAPFDFSQLIALSEVIAASPRREVKPRTRPQPMRKPADDLRIAPAPVFVEPREALVVSKSNVATCLTAITGEDAQASERYRTLGLRLLNMAAKRKLKTVIVTSAREREGKSTVATNLAWVMASAGERRVALIDANLDHPSICRMLGVKPQRGWLDVIEDGAQLSDAITRLDPNKLYLLAAGPEKSFIKRDALGSRTHEKLIAEIERHFDFIIIDAPAIKSTDAQRLASIADSTLMVVRAGHTPHDEVTEALKLVPRDACAGIVLNESDVKEQLTRKDRKTLLARLFGRGA
jgi:capsular exopolysaccharide synthesis family protein